MYSIRSSFKTLSLWQKIYCAACSVLWIGPSLFVCYIGLKIIRHGFNEESLSVYEFVFFFPMIVLIFLMLRVWKYKVWHLFKDHVIIVYDDLGIKSFDFLSYQATQFIPFEKIGFLRLYSPVYIEIQFKEVIYSYVVQTENGPVTVKVDRFEIVGDPKDIQIFLRSLKKIDTQIEEYPLGRNFDHMKEASVLFIGLILLILFMIGLYFLVKK